MIGDQQRAKLRQTLERAGISDQRVLEAIANSPREQFVPAELKHQAYDDTALRIGSGQTISQPYMVALMTQELNLAGNERVLEIGTGSGYQASILSQLCREVVTIERLPELSRQAQQVLTELGCTNIEFRVGDGTLGCPGQASFDGIVVTAAAPKLPKPLLEQLTMGGRLVIPVGDEELQTLVVVTRNEPKPDVRNVCGCRFVKLIGEEGWPAE